MSETTNMNVNARNAAPASTAPAPASTAPSTAAPMNIMYCGDGYIERGLLTSTLSLLENAGRPLNIYVLTADIGGRPPVGTDFTAFLNELVKRENPANSVTLIDATAAFWSQPPLANMDTRFTPCCMLRLYADLIDELPDRILYLDTDVMCARDCRELYDLDLGDAEFAGVLDYYGRFFFRRSIWHMDYMNSGVLLMNLARMRETGLLATCREECAERRMFMPDQSALNRCATRKVAISRRFNDQRRDHDDTVMRHFSNCFGFVPPRLIDVKPWQVERVHRELKTHTYDSVLDRFEREWEAFERERKQQEQQASAAKHEAQAAAATDATASARAAFTSVSTSPSTANIAGEPTFTAA